MKVQREYHYDSAHRLPNVPEGHKCGRLHGHTYVLTVVVEGSVQPNGFVMDFADLDPSVEAVLDDLDHHYLNEVPGLENPTVEVQLEWMWGILSATLPLAELRLREGLSNEASFDGN